MSDTDTGVEWLRYRHEFMRRDPKYIQHWREIADAFKDAKDGKISWEEFNHKEKITATYFGLDSLADPFRSYDDLIARFRKTEEEDDRVDRDDILKDVLFGRQKAYTVSEIMHPNAFAMLYNIRIDINFLAVNSIDALKDKVLEEITDHWKRFKSIYRKWGGKKKVDYSVFLKVGDLKRQGLTNTEIAKELFPRDFKEDNKNAKTESAIRKISNYSRKYQELVNGGWRNMRYP